jgi:hypothetical protein
VFDTRANVFIPLGVMVLVIALFTWFSPLRVRLRQRRGAAEATEERVPR